MAAHERRDLMQWAVLWPKLGVDAYGTVKFDYPVEVRIRWNSNRNEAVNPQSEVQAYTAHVIADRPMTIGSLMWLGRLSDLPASTGTPESTAPASDWMQVTKDSSTVDIKGRFSRYEYDLMRYKR
jgi:hypothetical protein